MALRLWSVRRTPGQHTAAVNPRPNVLAFGSTRFAAEAH
jgi:hypothetical protein